MKPCQHPSVLRFELAAPAESRSGLRVERVICKFCVSRWVEARSKRAAPEHAGTGEPAGRPGPARSAGVRDLSKRARSAHPRLRGTGWGDP